jgi:hypothetical protein
MVEPPAGDGLQFDHAESSAPPRTVSCALCTAPIADVYWRSERGRICTPCRDASVAGTAGSPTQRVLKALLLGALGGLVGAVPYFLVLWLSGYELGLLAIVVGVAVGIGVKAGSEGRGGRGYQVLAVLLTYLAITTTYIPVIIREGLKTAEQEAAAAKPVPSVEPVAKADLAGCVLAAGIIVALALILPIAAPFLAGPAGIMSWVIMGIALFEAWKITKATAPQLTGPYRVSPGPSAGAADGAA